MLDRTKGGSWTRGSTRSFAALSVALVVIAAPRFARAQGAQETAAAQGLFDQARTLMATGHVAEACPKFEESQRIAPAVGTLLNLGICYEREERTASAWATFKEAISAARAAGQSEREELARKHAAALEGKISTIAIDVPASMRDMTGLVLRRDGVEVPSPAWGVPIPVDAGTHRIEASAPGRASWSASLEVRGQIAKTIDVPVLAREKSKPAPPVKIASTPAPHVSHGGSSFQRTLGLFVGGIGIAGVGAGATFGLIARAQNDAAVAHHCGSDNLCDSQGVTLTNQARTSAIASTISFGVGGAALVTGAVLFFTAPKSSSPRVGLGVSPMFSTQGGGAQVSGSW